MRQNARAGLETLTRDIEMAGYQTTSYGDLNKTGLAITLARPHEIEMDQQRVEHTNGTVDWANPVYEPKLVYYHLATDMRTGRQNLYRQIRTQPGLPEHGRDRGGKHQRLHPRVSGQGQQPGGLPDRTLPTQLTGNTPSARPVPASMPTTAGTPSPPARAACPAAAA